MKAASLTLRAGPAAFQLLKARGLRAEDVRVLPGASGGAKFLVLGGLDRYLFGEFLTATRAQPLDLVGSSIGSWRMACLAQRDAVRALARAHEGYIYRQQYSAKPDAAEVTRVLSGVLDHLLGADGPSAIVDHPGLCTHIVTVQGHGLAGADSRRGLSVAMALAAGANVISRRTLGFQFTRAIFSTTPSAATLAHLHDLPTTCHKLTAANVGAALLASGSIPLLMSGVRMPDTPGLFWDGGITDYHLDLDFGKRDGLILYPHFYPYVVPGWFDKSLRWRRASAGNFDRALLIAPSRAFVASLPDGRIPDRRDFHRFTPRERERRWQRVLDESERLGAELQALMVHDRLVDALEPW